ncbi:MAG: SDR family oxidoreductase [Solirubrobacteraceae bacterium]
MDPAGRHVVVTGGAGGIGRALARAFATAGARAVTIADRDGPGAAAAAREIGALALTADVTREQDVLQLIADAEGRAGPIDVFVSNAGAVGANGGAEIETAVFDDSWRLHVLAHVWAARALVPGMRARGSGYLVVTASGAGLLANVRSLPYTVTKHAAVALAEWLSIAHHHEGIRSSALCPLGVRTSMLADPISASERASGSTLEPEEVAAATLDGMRAERCLILPHPEVATYFARRGADHERWLAGMRALHAELDPSHDR